jgi:predicted patatin/cPLA2 family phospholipase
MMTTASDPQAGLVLEGGGMRALYTAGVLEYFAEQNLVFPYIIGVSAGICMGASYLSGQRGRNRKVNIDYAGDRRYLSWAKFLRHRQELFGMDFIFDEIPRKLEPFDFQSFRDAPSRFVIGTTDLATGLSRYDEKSDPGFDLLKLLRASSSLPFLAPPVAHAGKWLMDGGIADPIPIRRAEQDGYKRNVLVLTRNENYVKRPSRVHWLVQRKFRDFPAFVEVMRDRHNHYNETLHYANEQQKRGAAFIIRPGQPMEVGRLEQRRDKLEALYLQGYEEAKAVYPQLVRWLQEQ